MQTKLFCFWINLLLTSERICHLTFAGFLFCRAHEAANAARKLTPEARRDKTIRKLKEDTSLGVHVAVFRVKELKNPQKKYKVDINAQQLYLTGMRLLYSQAKI